MERRKFLRLSVVTAALLPLGVFAKDYRAEKPEAWTAKHVDEAIRGLYGDIEPVKSDDVKIKLPKVAASGSAVPVGVKSDIDAKSVAMFQDSNPESAVAVWSVPQNGIVDYFLKLKLKKREDGKPTTITVVIEGLDGKFYTNSKSLVVAGGGCDT